MAKKRVNAYICPSGHKTITRDVDEGVTPFMIPCEYCQKEGKKSVFAKSAMYSVPQNWWDMAEIEWYKPMYPERIKHDGLRVHAMNGGLLKRKVGEGDETENLPPPKPKIKFGVPVKPRH